MWHHGVQLAGVDEHFVAILRIQQFFEKVAFRLVNVLVHGIVHRVVEVGKLLRTDVQSAADGVLKEKKTLQIGYKISDSL